VPASGSCTLSATFDPKATGARSATLIVTDNNNATATSMQTITLTGTGVAAPLAITASSATMTYGGAVPSITPGYVGFVNGDTAASLTTAAACATTATSSSPVGTYPTTCSGAVNANYTISYTSGTLSISKATSTTTITSHLPSPALLRQIVMVGVAVAPQFTGRPTGSVTVTASTGQSCTAALSAGAGSCQLTFTTAAIPTLTAAYRGDANFLASTSAGVPQTVGAVTLSTTSLAFGNQLVGTTSLPDTVTLTNVGSTALAISSIIPSTNFIDTTGCSTSLAAGASCNINVKFKPTATGLLTGILTITDLDPTSPQTVTLSGMGVAPVNSVSPLALTFGSPMNIASPSQPVSVINTGTAPLTIKGITFGGTSSAQFGETNTCGTLPTTLAVNATCTINVTFTPTAASPLKKSALLSVNVAAPAASVSVSLNGTIIAPTYTLSSNSLAFANQAHNTTSVPQTVTLTNGAGAPLTITNIVLGGTNPLQFAETNTCGTFPVTLAANGTCTISVTFHPTTIGAKSASVAVRVAAPAANQSISLTGTGQ